MTIKQILSLTANEINRMNKEELIDIARTMVDVARKRAKRLPKGPAYARLKILASNEGPMSVKGLSLKNGEVAFSKNFKTKNGMNFWEIKKYQKELRNYLKAPTSMKKGYEKYKAKIDEQVRKRTQIHDVSGWENVDDEYDVVDMLTSYFALSAFASEHIGLDSNQIAQIVNEWAPYDNTVANYQFMFQHEAMFIEHFKKVIKERMRNMGIERRTPIDYFYYNDNDVFV